MDDIVTIAKLNESYGFVITEDDDVIKKFYEHLSFFVPKYRFMPEYKNGHFDGRIKLFNKKDNSFPLGLVPHLYDFCCSQKIQCNIKKEVLDSFKENVFREDVQFFLEQLKFYSRKNRIYPRDDQYEATIRSIERKRCLNICPTSFGKSLSITMECLWYVNRGMKCMIVVPTKDLVDQFYNDIADYATNEEGTLESWYPKVQRIYSGLSKEIEEDTNICISTWQSLWKIYQEDSTFMNIFDVIILDECHRGQSTSIRELMLSAVDVKYRTGWTGSLSDEQISELLVTGLFGPKKVITTTKELMDKEIVAQLSIQVLRLKYTEQTSRDVNKFDYAGQSLFIENCMPRTNLLMKIVGTQTNTGLIFYRHIKHGKIIFDLARQMYPERNVYFVHGGHFQRNDKKYKTFEDIKVLIEDDENAIVIANYQLASTGISIKHLYWMMFFVPIKSFVSTVQSIGRVLRISQKKRKALLIDIVDDMSYKKRKNIQQNFALKHFADRFSIYNVNQFEYKIKTIQINV